jgi:uncharacterized protein YciI
MPFHGRMIQYNGSNMKRALLLLTLPLCAPAQSAPQSDTYYIAFLRPTPDRKPLAKEDAERLQSAHMANIHDMWTRGVLVAAGPFEDKPPAISGIFVFKTASREEAHRLADQDPTVIEHRNTIDVVTWHAPKGIGEEYTRMHKEDPKTPEGMGVQPFAMVYRGPSWDQAPEERAKVMAAHDAYIGGLSREGKLSAGGLAEGAPDLLAIVVFNRMPDDEAHRLIDADPAVKAGLFRVEYHRWWCAEHVLPK